MRQRKRSSNPSSKRPSRKESISRRDLLKGLVGIGAAAALSGCASSPKPAERKGSAALPSDAIRKENERPGTRDWLLQKTGVDPATKYRCPWIEGYCSRTSVRAGEEIAFHVSTNPASLFQLDIYRMGYYGGDGARHLLRLGPFPGVTQPEPAIARNRLRECQWEPCATLKIPDDWLSGVYLGKLTAERDGWQSYVIFIVRDDRVADFIFQCSDTTW